MKHKFKVGAKVTGYLGKSKLHHVTGIVVQLGTDKYEWLKSYQHLSDSAIVHVELITPKNIENCDTGWALKENLTLL